MIRLLRKLAVKTKLMSSFMILAALVLILGVTAIIIQQSLGKNQRETLASINLSDAFFEGKYFMRSDMHIFTEIIKIKEERQLNYWWGEHEFQILFFNDQLKKIEHEFLINKSIHNDTLQVSLLSNIAEIGSTYQKELLPLFIQLKKLKEQELQLDFQLKNSQNLDNQEFDIQFAELNAKYVALNEEVTVVGLKIIKNLDRGKDAVRVLIIAIQNHGQILMQQAFNIFLVFTIIGVLFSIFIAFYISQLITQPVNRVLRHVNLLGDGEHPEKLEINLQDEFGKIMHSLNNLTESLVSTSKFSKEIGEGNFDSRFSVMGSKDILGNSLLQMRDKLKLARAEQEKRRIEDEQRSWAANGLAKFGDIMRQSGESIQSLGYNLMSNMVDYVGATQGALFVINDNNENDVYYELIAAVAYNRNKYLQKQIHVGEGLVGRAVFEEKTIYLKEIPDNYVNITSGLGTSNPRTLLLVPVKLENVVNGVVELVSFKEFEPYQITFIEKLVENISSFIQTIKINEKTASLLMESQHKSEELAAQEEELRQNMEELQATQEEATRREDEQNKVWAALGKIAGIIETDLDGQILSANERIMHLLGVNKAELEMGNYSDMFFSDTRLDFLGEWQQISNGRGVVVNSNWTKSGNSITLLHHIIRIVDAQGKSTRVLCLIIEKV